VKAANWLSHLEFDWESPVWRHWLTELSADHTLVRYDERGCGLSDWNVAELSVEAYVQDLEAVVAAVGLERFPLLGISQGGAVAVTYAVRHPERVSQLILYGAYARGRFNRGYSHQQREQGRILLELIKLGWGQDNPATRQYFTSLFMPEATGEQMRAFNALQRVSASPENAVKLITSHYQIEVSALARQVTAPTLVLHVRDDSVVPLEESRHLAALIPGARFVALEGNNHILLENEPAWSRFLAEVRRFLAEDDGV
jgi:pimeloyl-ACP methyl ester carboxylesterase